MSEESEKVKNLARLKDYLERRMRDLRGELDLLEKLVELVDEQLAKLSFKKAVEIKEKPAPEALKVRALKSRSGEVLAKVMMAPNELRFIVSPSIELRSDMKPFSSFLVRKVLEAMRSADRERVEKGIIPPGQELDYEIIYENDRVKEIIVRNFREEYRLREIANAIRWTLETVASSAR